MTFLIIVGISVVVLVIIVVNNKGKKQNKGELKSLIQKMHKEMFPNGRKDIDEGTKELLRILNYSVDVKTAESILIKSSSICYTTSMNGSFSKERLKQHLAPYALNHFNDNTLSRFYDYLLSKSQRASYIEFARDFSKSSNTMGTDKDEMPEGYGEFGLAETNPVPTSSIADSTFYLDRLRTQTGSKITYDRNFSLRAPNIKHPVDSYSIFANGKEVATIYICAYNKKTSTKVPKGFKLN